MTDTVCNYIKIKMHLASLTWMFLSATCYELLIYHHFIL